MRKFKTESKKLLDLMANSIYTNKEIFLRELISNASDAVDKLYFKSLTDHDMKIGRDELGIMVSFDKDARTITVSDNGIGMDETDLESDLGTIAHSGSMEFKDGASADEGAGKDDVDIIGQFGVGFYSAFMVAKHVKVITKPYGSDEAYAWDSDGIEGYTISKGERATHGTDVILTLKDDSGDEDFDRYLTEDGLKHLIKKYSNYIRYPIKMECTKSREVPRPEDAGDDYKPSYEQYTELDTVNSMVPIWKHHGKEVSQDEYNEFYKSNFHDFSDPARTFSVHAEGALEYDALLFIPSRAPYDLYSKDFKKGLSLYSSGVLIMEKCEDLLPSCFGFVRGVVDSDDLSLNISRETLQQDRQLRAIESKLEKRIKTELSDMLSNDREGYENVFKEFGRVMKYGIYESYGAQAEMLSDLLLFYSAREQKMLTLDEYLAAAAPDQEAIYYAAGDSIERLAKMPIVASVLDRGFDVLLCTQDIDEFCFASMGEYKEKPLRNVAGGDLGLETEDEKNEAEAAQKENEALFSTMKDALGDKVTKVSVSTRLADAPACITAQGPISLEMEKVFANMPGEDAPKSERVLELNPKHPVFEALRKASDDGDAEKVKLYAGILYDQALLIEGLPIDDPVAYAKAVCELMK